MLRTAHRDQANGLGALMFFRFMGGAGAALAAAFGGSAAWACSCIAVEHSQAFREASAVFEGRVISSSVVPNEDDDDWGTILDNLFEVTRPIKGRAQATRVVRAAKNTGGNCGLTFGPDVIYRVYAHVYDGIYRTSFCSYTHTVKWSDEVDSPDTRSEFLEDWKAELLATISNPAASDLQKEYAIEDLAYLVTGEQERREIEGFIDYHERAVKRSLEDEVSRSDFGHSIRQLQQYNDYENLALAFLARSGRDAAPTHDFRQAGDAFLAAGALEDAVGAYKKSLSADRNNLAAREGLARAQLLLKGLVDPLVANYGELETVALDLSGHQGRDLDLTKLKAGQLDLSASDVSDLWLVGAEVGEIDMRDAKLRRARFDDLETRGGLQASGSSFVDGSMTDGLVWKADFADAVLTSADFTNTEFYGSDFSRAIGRNANFSGAHLKDANLAGGDFRKADFTAANLAGARFDCDTRLPADLDVVDAQMIPVERECEGVEQPRDFTGTNWNFHKLRELSLDDAVFHQSTLSGSDFSGSSLVRADFSSASGSASFHGSDLTDASFRRAKLNGVFVGEQNRGDGPPTFTQPAKLNGTDFTGAVLKTMSFLGEHEYLPQTRADVSGAIFDNVTMSCDPQWAQNSVEALEQSPTPDSFDWYPADEAIRNARWQHIKDLHDQAVVWLADERALVTDLAARFPSMTFDESCALHFEPAPERTLAPAQLFR